MPKKKLLYNRKKSTNNIKKPKRRSMQIRKLRPGTFLFGVTFVSELFIIPKKDRYIMIGFIKFELRLGRFYG